MRALSAALTVMIACTEPGSTEVAAPAIAAPAPGPSAASPATEPPPQDPAPAAEQDDPDFPLHGLVTGVQVPVREQPDPEATRIGVLRIGSRIRVADGRHPAPNCASGFVRLRPRGYACAGQGIEIAPAPPASAIAVDPPDRAAPLPYAYYYVNQRMTAEHHRPPTPEEQRATWAFARRHAEIAERDEARAARYLAGDVPGEDPPPAVVRRFMDRGFYIAVPPSEADGTSEFVRTVHGSYVWRARLERRTGSAFAGVEIGAERILPVVFMRRTARPRHRRPRADGTLRWAENPEWPVIERQTILGDWLRRERFEDKILHVLEGDRYLLAWFAGVAEPIDPTLPDRLDIGPDELFVHVDLSEQTLVAYRGRTPIFATLVSTALEGHETPTGFFRIQRKLVSDTMADLGPDAGDDRYRIEDVPWTQYFSGNIAIHGAFWHDQLGVERSHGCINLSPADAHRLFDLTEPALPPGWHGVDADRERPGSRVLVTR